MENSHARVTIQVEGHVENRELQDVLDVIARPGVLIAEKLCVIERKLDEVLQRQITEAEIVALTRKAVRIAAHMKVVVDRLETLT